MPQSRNMNAYANKVTAAFVDGPPSNHIPLPKGWILSLAAVKNPDGSVGIYNFDTGYLTTKVESKHLRDRVVTYSFYSSSKPDRRNRWIMHNCFRYRLIWVDD